MNQEDFLEILIDRVCQIKEFNDPSISDDTDVQDHLEDLLDFIDHYSRTQDYDSDSL